MDSITLEQFLSDWETGRKDFSNLDMSGVKTIENMNLDGVILNKASFRDNDWCDNSMVGASLNEVTMSRVIFENNNLSKANIVNATVIGTSFSDSQLTGANLTDILAMGSDFVSVNMINAVLTNGVFDGSTFNKAVMRFVVANNASFQKAKFNEADVSGADFREADLKGIECDGVVTELTKGWNVVLVPKSRWDGLMDGYDKRNQSGTSAPKTPKAPKAPKAPRSSSSGASVLNADGTIDITNVKKGDKIKMNDGWEGVMFDNSRNRLTRMVSINDDVGSTYCADIAYVLKDGNWLQITGQKANPMSSWRSVTSTTSGNVSAASKRRLKTIVLKKLVSRMEDN